MKFNLTLLGTLTSEIVYNTISFNEPWVPVSTNSLVMIGKEIVQIKSVGSIAVLKSRGTFNSTISTHAIGTAVYLLTVDVPLVEVPGTLNSELYPFIIEDLTLNAVSISGIDYIENLYTYGSLVSLSYPFESDLSDTSVTNISANVAALPSPTISEDASISYAITDIAKVQVVQRGYNEDEQASVSYAITDITKVNTVNSSNIVKDVTGMNTTLVSGSMAITVVSTSYTDGSGMDTVLISGTLS